ncbi:uncharacterized protein LTHEOB_3673 [Lasiodiplodia theobromae]|uniref:Uncharacterized protein n=1 Tax=Lasiodiplodia theobromae TaxID=45133 RepID=A0A5N5DG46_9PEZI|nr:uncharacterized protein LTHEOB_3673 [Lasiodiplodia theobromae]KAB2576725.1 hypothetical protein DBV05_g4723 [Lasiodiplodia theobromae]KAF4534060.1 hypothetical protein LTHEOB_3673 [Lasiodiplodia theobromae]
MSLTTRGWRAALRQVNRRTFSSSAVSQRHTLPTFEPSSNEDLDSVLDLARRRILIPAHLNKAQEQMVYREKFRARLSADAPEPVSSTVAGADVTLEHIDRQRDIPAQWQVFSDALRLADTPTDWENVGKLLEGFADAGVRMRGEWVQKFVREAAQKGALHVVLRALERAPRTNVRLRSRDVVSRVLWEVRGVAAENGWGEVETERAIRYAEKVVELMEREEHCGGSGKRVVKPGDLRTLPFVIATPLELNAVHVLRYKGGVDEDGVVEGYAKSLCNNLKHFGLQESTPTEESAPSDGAATTTTKSKSPNRYQNFAAAVEKLRRMVPVWHGLELARRVLQPQNRLPLEKVEVYRVLGEVRGEAEAAVEAMRANLKEGQKVENHADYQAWVQVRDEKE